MSWMLKGKKMSAKCRLVNSSNFQQFINSFDNVLTDCDGVLWNGEEAIKGTQDTLNNLRKLGKKIFFVTNNSTKNREDYLRKCQKLGYEAKLDEFYCTSNTIATYLKKRNFNKTVYVIGQSGLGDELDAVGIEHIGIGPDSATDLLKLVFDGIKNQREIGAVVVGLDREFNYVKLLKAASYLKNPECLFVASNLDDRFPVESRDVVVPGTGALVSAVKTASAREPVVLGKPYRFMFDAMIEEHNLNPDRTIMIGDRMDTDILFGSNCELKTLMVLTGISSLKDVERCERSKDEEDKKLIPDYYVEQLGDIGDLLNCG